MQFGSACKSHGVLLQGNPGAAGAPRDPLEKQAQELLATLAELESPGLNVHRLVPQDGGAVSYEVQFGKDEMPAVLSGQDLLSMLEQGVDCRRESVLPSLLST